MTTFGYIRVSTKKQSLERQIQNVSRAYPDAKLYSDKYTGTKSDRPAWQMLLKKVRKGDTIVFDSVSRMSRNSAEGWKTYKDLYDKGINLIFVKEPFVNTDQYRQAMAVSLPEVEDSALQPMMDGIQKTLMLLAERQFISAFDQAEKEVQDLRQRTKEGMQREEVQIKLKESAKAKTGRTLTTKKSMEMKEKIRKISRAFEGQMKDAEVIDTLKIAPNTYYKYKKEMKGEKK